jgi:hypothetical protein
LGSLDGVETCANQKRVTQKNNSSLEVHPGAVPGDILDIFRTIV